MDTKSLIDAKQIIATMRADRSFWDETLRELLVAEFSPEDAIRIADAALAARRERFVGID